MKTKDFFKINGVSSDEFTNVLVNLPPIPPLAEQKYTEYDSGSDEPNTIPDNAFKDIRYSVTFWTIDIPEYDNTALYKLIAEAKTLEISRLPDYFYKVRKAVLAAPSSAYDGQKVKYVINFTLAPFKYRAESDEFITATSGAIFINNGTRYSKPVLKITGKGKQQVIVNGEIFEISFPEDEEKTYIIDSERLIVYDVETNEIQYNVTSGKFPIFLPGNNQVIFGTSLSYKINERSY